ncbi:MAG TPA: alpha-N-acetylglucosaminidase [Bacteroidales bacterium]|nr:alpha-N-acetylglucosaminidase [Bacteroidales bacterium]
MINRRFLIAGILLVLLFTVIVLSRKSDSPEIISAMGVIERVLPEHSKQFILRTLEKEGENDIFEIEAKNNKIHISGTSGIAICSGFNYYLKYICNATWNWRCGNNLNIKGNLPLKFEKIRKESPYRYRYIFNYCTFSYTMSFWDWEQWERMIDWMAMNGINMPLAPMGQEIIWQRVYKKFGLSEKDLEDFFVGPAYNAFGRMGCIDGFGGPLPQSWIDNECVLQKKILQRERELGMTPVLQGFTGHVPPAFARKNPQLKFTNLTWIDFEPTVLLGWEEPLFTEIGKEFILELEKEYGTDHLYAVDQFIEMEPANGDTLFLKNMSCTIYNSIIKADPEGKWVIQTWPFKELLFWNKDRTKAYFDGVPDDRMIALELMGESWHYTGWYKHDGWYGKPWVWSIISNFGDNVSMFGGLKQIDENFRKALSSPDKGNLCGMGLMMEGLDYNPVTYQLVTDMIWEKEVPDPENWKKQYLTSRYGSPDEKVDEAWKKIFSYYYVSPGLFEPNPVISRPAFMEKDINIRLDPVVGAKMLIDASDKLKEIDSYQFDIVNISRQIFGQYAGHILYEINDNYRVGNLKDFDLKVAEFKALARKIEELMTTREEFLFGKWVADSRERATNAEEAKLYEWNARAIITTWGGRVLYGYAIKDWAGLYTSYYLPKWEMFFAAMRNEITGGEKLNYENFKKEIILWEDNWITLREEKLIASPEGNAVELAKELWNEYGEKLLNITEPYVETN